MPFPLSFARERHKLRMNEGKSQCVEKDGPLRFGQGGDGKIFGERGEGLASRFSKGKPGDVFGKDGGCNQSQKASEEHYAFL